MRKSDWICIGSKWIRKSAIVIVERFPGTEDVTDNRQAVGSMTLANVEGGSRTVLLGNDHMLEVMLNVIDPPQSDTAGVC